MATPRKSHTSATRPEDLAAEVIVVGAGPVGLLLAAEVALGGASVLVLERSAEVSETIKAGSINLASAEILARRGMLAAARAAHERAMGPIVELFAARADGSDLDAVRERVRGSVERAGHFAGIGLDAELVDPEDPDVASHREGLGATLVAQRDLEALLADHAAGLGVPVRRGVTVTGVRDTDGAVSLATDAGSLRARWVVGCDGGRSVVRHAEGIGFSGTDPELTGHQAVVELDDASVLTPGWNWTPRGVYRYGPLPGVVLTVEFDGPPADRDRPVTAEEIEASLRRTSGTEVTVRRLRGEATRWSDNARRADRYRCGRVLLAGDAAHVHSPFSGQGLNLGLGDATNLGWKLAATVRGDAPEGLLDSYDAERRPLGESVLDWTRAQVALMRPDPKVGLLRDVVAQLMATPAGMTQVVNVTAGITQAVKLPEPHHPLAGRLVPDLRTADGRSLRERFATGRFVLLDRTPDQAPSVAARPWGDRLVSVIEPPPGAGAGGPAALLARPDGVVVWAVDPDGPVDPEALREVLVRWAGVSPAAMPSAR